MGVLANTAALIAGYVPATGGTDENITIHVGNAGPNVFYGFSDGNGVESGADFAFGSYVDNVLEGTNVVYITVQTSGRVRVGLSGYAQKAGVSTLTVTFPGLPEGPITCNWNGTWYQTDDLVLARATYAAAQDGNQLSIGIVQS